MDSSSGNGPSALTLVAGGDVLEYVLGRVRADLPVVEIASHVGQHQAAPVGVHQVVEVAGRYWATDSVVAQRLRDDFFPNSVPGFDAGGR